MILFSEIYAGRIFYYVQGRLVASGTVPVGVAVLPTYLAGSKSRSAVFNALYAGKLTLPPAPPFLLSSATSDTLNSYLNCNVLAGAFEVDAGVVRKISVAGIVVCVPLSNVSLTIAPAVKEFVPVAPTKFNDESVAVGAVKLSLLVSLTNARL